MCDFFHWDRDDVEREEARQALADLENWHKLCIAVCIEPLPATISECKEVCDSNKLVGHFYLILNSKLKIYM
jgi:hypothetical protein